MKWIVTASVTISIVRIVSASVTSPVISRAVIVSSVAVSVISVAALTVRTPSVAVIVIIVVIGIPVHSAVTGRTVDKKEQNDKNQSFHLKPPILF